ncbi:hypothetical protein PG985_000041 [Apiospora marii]|uniref:Uncharacterized protein n=1 Tax=Apiospora marii TaxID=335849 RepID=A0ABR1QZN5_9PEZI
MVFAVFLLATAFTWLQVSAAPAAAPLQARGNVCVGDKPGPTFECMAVNADPACGIDWNPCHEGWLRACYDRGEATY